MNPQFESVYPRAPAPYVPAPVPIVIVPLTSNLDDGLVVPMPTFPPKYAFPVVVAPPKIVRPVACPPAPIVEDASARKPPSKYDMPLTLMAVEEANGNRE